MNLETSKNKMLEKKKSDKEMVVIYIDQIIMESENLTKEYEKCRKTNDVIGGYKLFALSYEIQRKLSSILNSMVICEVFRQDDKFMISQSEKLVTAKEKLEKSFNSN